MAELNYIYRDRAISKLLSLKEITEMIRLGKYKKIISEVQEELDIVRNANIKDSIPSCRKVPYVVWSKGKDGYTGHVLLSLPCKDEAQVADLRRQVNAYHHVVCTFRGMSGRTLKVVVAYSLPSGEVSKIGKDNPMELTLFHSNAYCRAAAFLLATTGIKSTGKGEMPDGGCRISCDEEIYVNENVTPLIMEMPTKMPDGMLVGNDDIKPLVSTQYTLPSYSELAMAVTNYNLLVRNMGIDTEVPDELRLMDLAHECCLLGIEEEIAVKCTLSMNSYKGKDMLVRTCFEAHYSEKEMGNRTILPKATLNLHLMERFLTKRYRFRMNELTGSVEYTELNRYIAKWLPFTERSQNTIITELLKAGIEIWDRDLKRYVNSTLIRSYDPIEEWISALPAWDGHDRITELTNTIKSDWDKWPQMFRTWLRSMVSQWSGINRKYGATMVLMLTGRQGTGKSTFMKRLLPPELSSYYVDRLDFTNKKDAERALIRFCLINLDEYDQISPRQAAFLKHILQKSDITYRKMYQDDIEQRRRYAAFCATTNSDTPLTDLTGSRRYLVIEVTDIIDNKYKIDYQQLYAQIVAEIRSDSATYFNTEDENIIQEHNLRYTTELPVGDMFDSIFRPAERGEEPLYLTSTEILIELKNTYKSSIKIDHSTTTQLGRYLANHGIHSVMKDRKRVYLLFKR